MPYSRGEGQGWRLPPPVPMDIGAFMAGRKKVYEGKAKILYEVPEPGTLIQYFKDDSAPTSTEALSLIHI